MLQPVRSASPRKSLLNTLAANALPLILILCAVASNALLQQAHCWQLEDTSPCTGVGPLLFLINHLSSTSMSMSLLLQ